jgi:hypothetical protein
MFGQVARVQRGRGRGKPRVEVRIPQHGHAARSDESCVLHSAHDVPTGGGSEVDAHRSGLELGHHVGRDEGRCLLARDERCGNHDVDLLALLREHAIGRRVPLSRHLLGVSSRAFATLLEVHLQELGAHRLPSRGHRRAVRGHRREVRGEVSRERSELSEVLSGHPRQSEVIRGHQRSSEVREVLSGHPRQPEVIRGHQRSAQWPEALKAWSEALRGPLSVHHSAQHAPAPAP